MRQNRKGSVIVDVAVDRGGCEETTHATTHSNPTYEIDGVVHYRIANMLGAVRKSRALQYGLNTLRGFVTYPTVADAFALIYIALMQALSS